MTEQHSITPPPELVRQWWAEFESTDPEAEFLAFIATKAARWGADMELEACCECINDPAHGADAILVDIRAARRPKPPSSKERKEESSIEPEYHPNLWSAFKGMCKELF